MSSFRASVLIAALVLLPALQASACSCGESTAKERFARADLVIRGRVKAVTYGDVVPSSKSLDELSRATRGEIEIEKVLKGTFEGKTVSVYTGSGMGDCGLLGFLLNVAIYYDHEKFGVLELGLTKFEHGGETYYSANMCEYVKGPKDDE